MAGYMGAPRVAEPVLEASNAATSAYRRAPGNHAQRRGHDRERGSRCQLAHEPVQFGAAPGRSSPPVALSRPQARQAQACPRRGRLGQRGHRLRGDRHRGRGSIAVACSSTKGAAAGTEGSSAVAPKARTRQAKARLRPWSPSRAPSSSWHRLRRSRPSAWRPEQNHRDGDDHHEQDPGQGAGLTHGFIAQPML